VTETPREERLRREAEWFERQCSGKKGYSSRREAARYMRRMRRPRYKLGTYHCRWCGLWHFGSKKPKRLLELAEIGSA